MKDETAIILTAILALTVLEICAMIHNINGQTFLTCLAAICGLAGYTLRVAVPQGVVTLIKEKIAK